MRRFWVARFGRIYPLFILLLTTGLIAKVFGVDSNLYPYTLDFGRFLKNALLIGRFNVFWTISTEFQFYLLFALCWYFGHQSGNPRNFASTAAGLLLLTVFLNIYSYPEGPVYKTIHFFAAGILAGVCYKSEYFQKFRRSSDVILAIAIVFFFLSLPLPFERITGFSHQGFYSPYLLLLSFVLVLSASLGTGITTRLLGSSPLMLLGNLSFAIYLLHIPILHLVKYILPKHPMSLQFTISITSIFIFSFLVFYYFESPVRAWARRAHYK